MSGRSDSRSETPRSENQAEEDKQPQEVSFNPSALFSRLGTSFVSLAKRTGTGARSGTGIFVVVIQCNHLNLNSFISRKIIVFRAGPPNNRIKLFSSNQPLQVDGVSNRPSNSPGIR